MSKMRRSSTQMSISKLRRQLTNSSIKSIPNEEIDYYTIIEIKNHLLKLDKENDDAFDKSDIQKYVQDTKYLRKFIQRKVTVDESTRFISNILGWRKEVGLPKLNLNSFPREWYTCELYHLFENDLNGDLVSLIRGEYFQRGEPMKEMVNVFICFMCYYIHDKLLQKGENFCLTVIFDATNVSLSQYDIDFISYLIDLLTNKLPVIVKSIVLYDLPWYCTPLMKTVLLFVPDQWKKVIVQANSKSIKKYVAKESLPEYFSVSTRKEPIKKLTTIDDKKLFKDFSDEELEMIGMKRKNMEEYLKILAHWNKIDHQKMKKR